MKSRRSKSHKTPLTDLQRLAQKVEDYRLPSGPFDYAVQARAVREAQQFFHEIVREGKRYYADPEAHAIIEAARRLYSAALEAAYPAGFWEDYQRLRAGGTAGLESVVRFLEADPYFFRSGCIKVMLIRAVKPSMLKPSDIARLQSVVLSLVDRRDDRDFRAFCCLAKKVDDAGFREQLRQRADESNFDVRRRARWVLDALAQKDRMEEAPTKKQHYARGHQTEEAQ